MLHHVCVFCLVIGLVRINYWCWCVSCAKLGTVLGDKKTGMQVAICAALPEGPLGTADKDVCVLVRMCVCVCCVCTVMSDLLGNCHISKQINLTLCLDLAVALAFTRWQWLTVAVMILHFSIPSVYDKQMSHCYGNAQLRIRPREQLGGAQYSRRFMGLSRKLALHNEFARGRFWPLNPLQ